MSPAKRAGMWITIRGTRDECFAAAAIIQDALGLTQSSGFVPNPGNPAFGRLDLNPRHSTTEVACLNPRCDATSRWPKRGLCQKCYSELLAVERTTGGNADHLFGSIKGISPFWRTSISPRSDPKMRLITKIAAGQGGCWIFTGSLDQKGYGKFTFDGHNIQAHRASYLIFVGNIPNGLQLDHLCRNPRCIRPDHLEPVTPKENIRRSARVARTHCPQGHPYSGDNLRLRQPKKPSESPWRGCKACERISRQRSAARRRAAVNNDPETASPSLVPLNAGGLDRRRNRRPGLPPHSQYLEASRATE